MKTFADVKRRFAPGVVLECVENTYRRDCALGRRTIAKVQTNALACTLDGQKGLFWTYLPPAKHVTVIDDNTFKMALIWGTKVDPDHTVTLRFVP